MCNYAGLVKVWAYPSLTHHPKRMMRQSALQGGPTICEIPLSR